MSLNIVSSFNGVSDPDAARYIADVEAADGNQPLEFAVGNAINNFVLGCKADGIWDAIKASCILAGARTFAGALIPLKGTAPNKFGTEGNWVYDRKLGLQGDGTTNYLDSNRANNADPQNNNHNAYYASAVQTGASSKQITGDSLSSGSNNIRTASSNTVYFVQNRSAAGIAPGVSVTGSEGFIGVARTTASAIDFRANEITSPSIALASQTPSSGNILFFTADTVSVSNARLSFYSVGEALDLAKLDTRISTLITAIGAAIP